MVDATPPDAGLTYEVAPEYLEHARLEALHEQPDLPWEDHPNLQSWPEDQVID